MANSATPSSTTLTDVAPSRRSSAAPSARRLKGLPQAAEDAFWKGLGRRLEANMRATATEAVAAFKQFSAAGLVAGAADRHLVTQAQRHLAEEA